MLVLLVGFAISLLGQLPLGNMNLAATQMGVQESYKNAWLYGLGIAIVEMIYLRISLTGMNWIMEHKLIFEIMGWATVALFLILGIVCIVKAYKQKDTGKEEKGFLLKNNMPRFLLGVTMSAINPVQIPFWFIWANILIQKNILTPNDNADYTLFTVGAGAGTLAGIALYIHGGSWLIKKLKAGSKTINYIMGGIFIVTALLQLYKIVFDPWTKKSY